jgi:hypothetical protein
MLRHGTRGGVLCATLALAACEPPEGSLVQEARVGEAPLTVDITGMDNARHVLSGCVSGRAQLSRVDLYDGERWVGQAELEPEATRWHIAWRPEADTRSIEVRAWDVLGRLGRARIDLQRLGFESEQPLRQSESLLSLPEEAGTQTRYTLDGSTPTPWSPLAEGPLVLLRREGEAAPLSLIPTNPDDAPPDWRWRPPRAPVPLATVVRVQRFSGVLPVGYGEVRTYLLGASAPTLPVVSLVSDADNFFEATRGIYVPGRVHEADPSWDSYWGTGNYMQEGKEWERPVHVEWFEPEGPRRLAQFAGVRIHGSGSAALPQKSLRLYAKDDYGPALFQAALFPRGPRTGFKRLILRSSGQDLLSTKLKDCALQEMLVDVGLDLQACRPAVVYLNGEYWGLHELRERYDEYYLAQHHGVDRQKVVMVLGTGELDVGSPGDEQAYARLLSFVRDHDLTQEENFAYVQTLMDVDNFIDYTLVQLFFGNADWPQNNMKAWRYNVATPGGALSPRDGRWRWLVYDLDFAFAWGADSDSLRRLLTDDSLPDSTTLLARRLLAVPEFKARFVSRFSWHLDTTFSPERTLARVDALAKALAPEMPAQVDRWNHPSSMAVWSQEVQTLREALSRRPAFMRQFLASDF